MSQLKDNSKLQNHEINLLQKNKEKIQGGFGFVDSHSLAGL